MRLDLFQSKQTQWAERECQLTPILDVVDGDIFWHDGRWWQKEPGNFARAFGSSGKSSLSSFQDWVRVLT